MRFGSSQDPRLVPQLLDQLGGDFFGVPVMNSVFFVFCGT